jgi:hypothetical protein
VLTLAGCIGSTLLSSQRPFTVESLEGDYLRVAWCTYERLNRKDGRVRMADSSDRDSVKIDFDPGSSQRWYLSFINEQPGRLTRLEMTLPRIAEGSFPREHALATARACAALLKTHHSIRPSQFSPATIACILVDAIHIEDFSSRRL